MKLNLLVLRTTNLEEMRAFYSSLGANFEIEQHGNDPQHYAATLSDGLVLELYPAVDGVVTESELRLGLSVDDIGETLRLLGQSAAPRKTKFGQSALVRDPDGRTVELMQQS